ncbi:autotransporter outer membrane beta-barrel domain-containing protein [Pseudomonas yamanorum]|uniref:Autotransporter outer membrane beta-barrel domain-containing protein n=1 Tax=Pseudomonas yamanorum TaxID=515393 RepID=A0ABU1D081_9PSED|nr:MULTISPECIES: autotransporter outer membrane beta-barrel domain-containing protein [Pseudomonas]MBK5408554.1 autotransporter outer membrane beta-barrel domain-containing protein [Pseudomonas sp. TH34]MBV6659306.1 autotransporter outer membrane beta-barrel domain-containing protein [Pseudomonas yamanorum]MDR0192952.1 autotransporter outer membrane beta-barrel domain-containing protein [Pseudomonas yamanorum]NVZ92548.1 autotransporter outer membrane beta-barrel domain-containing protein [Pseud
MITQSLFKLNPLAVVVKVASIASLLALAPHAQARLIENRTETIDFHDVLDSYTLENATLNVIEGRTESVYAARSNLNLSESSTVLGTVVAQAGSNVNVDSSRVVAQGDFNSGITLYSSNALINGSVISSADYHGLVVNRFSGSTVGSSATVNDSVVSGATGGAVVGGHSVLNLDRSILQGIDAGSFGLQLQGAEAHARQSVITGGLNGVVLTNEPRSVLANSLVLDNTHVTGETGAAIVVRGLSGRGANATIEVLNGSTLSGGNGNLLEVKDGSSATVRVDNSQLMGNVIVESGSITHLDLQNRAALTGRLENVSSLSIGSQSLWDMTGNSQVGALNLSDGMIRFGASDAFYQLDLASLSGNGTFVMGTDFARGLTDFLNITGSASGNHQLLLSSSGVEPVSASEVRIVHTGGGDAQFSLVGGAVDVGAWSYGLKQDGNDWFLDPSSRVISPGTRSVLALFNAAPTVWYGELSSLRSRMGELRHNGAESGGWVRSYGNKYEAKGGAGNGYTQSQRGFSLGADMPVMDSPWLLGVMAGHSESDLDVGRGTSGTIKSYYVGAYATWMDEDSGYYFDGVAKVNHLRNDSKVGLSDGTQAKGDYATNALGVSAEVGRNIRLDDGFFVEPFAQASVMTAKGKSYQLDNGMQAKGDHTHSVLGKLGVTVGRDFVLDSGSVVQPYLRGAVAHEFAKNNKVSVNNQAFNNDLSGSRAEFGAGVAVSLSQNLQLHADFEHAKGKRIDQPWGANVGVRYSW